MTAPTANQTRPPTPTARPSLPKGLRWSNAWKVDGVLTESPDPAVEMPVDGNWELTGTFWVCPSGDCPTTAWTFEPVESPEDEPACTRHLTRLVASRTDAADPDPQRGAYRRAKAHLRGVYERRRDQAIAAAQTKAAEAQQAVADAARTTAADMKEHRPSIAISAGVFSAGVGVEVVQPGLAALAGFGIATAGTIAAYMVAYWLRRIRKEARRDAARARKDRAFARRVASGVLATGLWLLGSATTAALPMFVHALLTMVFGLLLLYAVNRAHWDELWDARHRIKDMNRRKALADARRAAEEAARLAKAPADAGPEPAAAVDETDPLVVGERMAAEWRRVGQSPAAGTAFPQMIRTRVDPVKTAPLMAPIDGRLERIGWEYYGLAEPGTLVARPGTGAPIIAAKDWLAAVLFDGAHDPANVSIVDRPGGAANRFTLIVTDSLPLGEPVRWQGRAGVKWLPDGTVQVHTGRALDGKDVYQNIYVPTQAFGGLTTGTRGGGKTGGTILRLLNLLVAQMFPLLYDPKQLVDYADFIGVFPIGVTLAHRDVFLDFLVAERKRRERLMGRTAVVDEFGRKVHGESRWDLKYGPPIAHIWEEFHDLAQDEPWVNRLTNHIRFERSSAMGGDLVTQGGGLADISNSILRGLLQKTELTTYRQDDHQARLAGRKDGSYSVSDLPPLPGMRLVTSPETPDIPMRTAFVPRKLNDPESVFNQLYGRSAEKVLQLPPPRLPEETLAVMRRTGLWEIWQRAQGEDGLDQLLADAEDEEYGGPSPVGGGSMERAAGPMMKAVSVVLAIAWKHPSLGPTAMQQHPLWLRPVAGGRPPKALSSITRPAVALENAGKLTRDGGYQVTTQAAAEAERLYLQLVGPAEKERREEEAAEVPA